MKNSLLVFGTENFKNLLNEINEYLDFSLTFYNDEISLAAKISTIDAVLIESEVCNNSKIISLVNKINNKPILLAEKKGVIQKCNYTEKVFFPLILSDLNSKILNLITSQKFNLNSSLKIKDYIVDKNEKKLTKRDLSIFITEREIQLIELLVKEKQPQSKNKLLKQIWNYAADADTHTVETHIYRLRKKILVKFSDNNFIINSKAGYTI